MGILSTNTAKNIEPDQNPLGSEFAEEAVQRLDAIRNDQPGSEMAYKSLAQPGEEEAPQSGEIKKITSLVQGKSPSEPLGTIPPVAAPAPAAPAAPKPAPKLVPPTAENSALPATPAAAPAPAVLEKSAEEYANQKGIPCKFPNPNMPGELVEGRLVEWEDNGKFRVVGFAGDTLITKVFDAGQLIALAGNESLRGAVEFARQYKEEVNKEGSAIRSMLSSVLEKKTA